MARWKTSPPASVWPSRWESSARSFASFRLRGYTPEKDPLRFFFDRVQDCLRGLWELIDTLANQKGIKIEPPAWPSGR
jgi:hypothetical protein